MKVYVLAVDDYASAGSPVIDVYATRELARAALKAMIEADSEGDDDAVIDWDGEDTCSYEDDNHGEATYRITEHEIVEKKS